MRLNPRRIDSGARGRASSAQAVRSHRLKPSTQRAAARPSADRYRHSFLGNACPMWVFDAATLAFLEVNDAAVRLYGHPRGALLRMTVDRFHLAKEVKRLVEGLRRRPRGQPGIWR